MNSKTGLHYEVELDWIMTAQSGNNTDKGVAVVDRVVRCVQYLISLNPGSEFASHDELAESVPPTEDTSQKSITESDQPDQQEVEDDSRPTKRQRRTHSPLCIPCQRLDLDSSFHKIQDMYQISEPLSERVDIAPDGTVYYTNAVLVHRFQDRLSTKSNCPLCSFFRQLRVLPGQYDRYKLLAFGCTDSWLFRRNLLQTTDESKEITEAVFMAVVPDIESIPSFAHEEKWLEKDIPAVGAICRQKPDEPSARDVNIVFCARELEKAVDMTIARNWRSICKMHHGETCEKPGTNEPVERAFRLIDCIQDPPTVIEQEWGVPFVALSYVWGDSAEDNVPWPATVLDAVAVTKGLGLQYLWVDRLCINQSDEVEKAYLISKMTAIYEEADCTIVAAAGSGAASGLPGVRATMRGSQPKYALDSGNLLLSILPDPRRDIINSKHWTRGWTYQEGVLSKRRLTFTKNQLYWECQSMAAQESIDMRLFHQPFSDPDESKSRMAGFMLSGVFKGETYSGGIDSNQENLIIVEDDDYRLDYGFQVQGEATMRAQLRSLNEHIRAFSKRTVRDEDSLRAFLGILGVYKRSKLIHVLHGIPMWMGAINERTTGAQVSFVLAIGMWHHRSGNDMRMFVAEHRHRRPNLPSWTWAGWEGAVTWRALPESEQCTMLGDLIDNKDTSLVWAADVSLGYPNTESIKLPHTHTADELVQVAPIWIEIENPLILNTFHRTAEKEKPWHWARMIGRAGRHQRLRVRDLAWDKDWHRVGGRLCVIALSISMTEAEWTLKHVSGELISVLIYAGKEPGGEHGRGLFLTLRRVTGVLDHWERVGVFHLLLPHLHGPGQLLALCNVTRHGKTIIVQ